MRTQLEYYQDRTEYWHEECQKAHRRANSAIAGAKKSKERELTAIRMLLKLKPFEKAILEVSKAEQESEDYVSFGNEVIRVLRGLGYECE